VLLPATKCERVTPEAAEISQWSLTWERVAPMADLPADQPVNGQGPYESWTINLPMRGADGFLSFKSGSFAQDNRYCERLSAAHEGEHLFVRPSSSWASATVRGHLYNGRDCSGLKSDLYRSMGLILPPNSGAQARALPLAIGFLSASDSHKARVEAVMNAQVGDLVVVPGHVLMILGKIDGQPYVIQDVPFAVFYDQLGKIHWTKLNEVSVTPFATIGR